MRAAGHPPLRRFAVVGDVHGDFAALADVLADAAGEVGKLDAVFSVGDLEPLRDETDLALVHGPTKYRELGTFPDVLAGRICLPAPLWFIGGNHEPWAALDLHGPGEWAPGVHYLGRSGRVDVGGVTVAFLSGIYSPTVSERPARDRREEHRPGRDRKVRGYWVREELGRAGARRADLLLTHDWPAGIGTDRNGQPAGNADLAALCARVRPQVHACGHMHHELRGELHGSRVVALGHIRAGRGAVAVFDRAPNGTLTELPLR